VLFLLIQKEQATIEYSRHLHILYDKTIQIWKHHNSICKTREYTKKISKEIDTQNQLTGIKIWFVLVYCVTYHGIVK